MVVSVSNPPFCPSKFKHTVNRTLKIRLKKLTGRQHITRGAHAQTHAAPADAAGPCENPGSAGIAR